ncbi:EAL domain-containing protein [Bradyrhizobium sp. 190]|uniref:putative bifunctional diguanylate cyclase/phosphodiesterase n=1 Tax=Bradyrhizobium sp. 190 TaxID=2782658 RepID=UPI001FF946A3|nr:EAL domain-containing protein [Bradyrhizobium sp. 190]MCK1511203.1 EAL domain-containing protein [Bradyrhizobium sp. 190]
MSIQNTNVTRLEDFASQESASTTASNAEVRPHLLIVDDISDNRAILSRRFERRGFTVTEAESGLAAIELIERETFDLVLLDVMMPGIDGIETLKRIRDRKSASALPVIMVTAKSESTNIVDALECGANDYVTKPVDFSVAMARVNTQISRRRAEQQVEHANEQLRRTNEALEARVEERTKRLADANQRLKEEISDREELQARSQYLAYHDSLTGLGNRLLFKEQLEQALTDETVTLHPLAVLFVDLDGFKAVNDTGGHSVGDLLLKSLSAKLRDLLPPTDRIARLGGDEFAILQISGVQPSASIALAERIIGVAAHPQTIEGNDVTVGASVGIAIVHPGEMNAETVLKCADLAMYSAKSGGRGTFRMFDPKMDAAVQTRRSLERDMRNALAQGDFSLFYQPLVNLQTKKVTAFEALMRWHHPERGSVAPSDFIPVAEEMGLILPLGEWALRQACMEAVHWPDEINLSVNLSPLQFAKGNLVSTVMSALASSGLPANRLELEITESVLLEKSERNIGILNHLRSLGVRISMDDFGTGYSSIGYLRSFPFDKIKIDQSFVRDVLVDEGSLAIVRAIAGLGVSFGMTTTAEGVETEEQMRCLNREGCIEVQGYLLSKPVPPAEVAGLLERLAAKAVDALDSGS